MEELEKQEEELRKIIKVGEKQYSQEKIRYFVPTDRQEEFIRPKHKIKLFFAANKCLPLDAPILMADGTWKKLGSIKVGDKVIGCDYITGNAEPTIVIGTSRAGKKKVFKISFNQGGYVIASKEHSFPTLLKSGKRFLSHRKWADNIPKKRKLSTLLKRQNVSISCKTRFLKPSSVKFLNKKLPLHPYLVGALLGDGSLGKGLGFTSKDTDIIFKVNSLLNNIGYELRKQKGDNYDYRISSIKPIPRAKNGFGTGFLKQELIKLGLIAKCGDKRIPHIYKISDIESREELLAGLIDTDGCYEEFTSKSEQLTKDFVFLVNSLGGKANYKPTIKICTNNGKKGTYYRATWYLDRKLPLCLQYKNERKNRITQVFRDRKLKVVKDIEALDKEVECGDIEVAHPSHTYISYDWIITGNTGKTCNTIIEDISHCIGYRPYLSPKDPDYKTGFEPPVKIRIYGEDFTQHIGGVIVPALKEWIPHTEFTYKDGNPKKNPQGVPTFWRFKNGSTIELLTYEQSSEKSEGWDGHVVHFDEPPPRPTYIAAKRGLIVNGGICLFSLTPLKEPWLYDELWLRGEKEDIEEKSVFCIDAKIETNLRYRRKWWRPDGDDGMAWCGKLKQRDIDDFEKDLTPDEKLARLEGKFMHLSGLVYKEFNPNIHIQPWFQVPNTWTFYEAIDPATRKPWAVTFMAVSPDGTKYIVDEVFVKGVVSDIAEAILIKRKQLGYQKPALATIIDPLAVAEDPISKTTVLNEFMKYGIFCQVGSKDRNRGIQLLKQELIIRDTDSKAGIYVFDTCRRTITEFGHYIWDEHSTRQARTSSDIKEIPKKVYDDMLENIHRLMIAGFGYIEPRPQQKQTNQIQGIGR